MPMGAARWLLPGLVIAVIAAGADAAGIKVKTEHDRSADLAALRSYAWLPTPPYIQHVAPAVRKMFAKFPRRR